jgi:hypothetical protein
VALNTIKQNNNIDQRMNKKHGMPQIHFTDWFYLKVDVKYINKTNK